MTLEILFENADFLIIHKPSGMVVHPFDHSTEVTLLDHLVVHTPHISTTKNTKLLQDGRTISLGGIVHKLDRDTSGVMVVAKNDMTYDELIEQFRNHTVTKTYKALVEGKVHNEPFIIDAPLGRNKKDYKQVVNPLNLRGELRDAVTSVREVSYDSVHDTSLLELTPRTGRTHQLRAHMAYIGHPIVGDISYGSTRNAPRIMLHAESVTFTCRGERYMFTADRIVGFNDLTVDTIK